MKTLAQLREEKELLAARPVAIVDIAKAENREELTDEEKAEIDGILNAGGKLDKLDADIARLEAIEAKQKELAKAKTKETLAHVGSGDIYSFVVPAKAKARHQLVAYKGNNAEREAYIAGQWALATMAGNEYAKEFLSGIGIDIRAGMSTGNNEKGGYTVPDVLEASIITLVESWGAFRRNIGRVWPIMHGSLQVPKHGSDFTWYWVGEAATGTESDATLELVELVAKKGMVLGRVSSELFEDTVVSIGDYFTQSIARAAAYAEDIAAFRGDGTSTYGGIVGLSSALAAGSIATAEANDNTLAELTIAPVHELMGKIPNYEDAQNKWYMHKSVWENAFKRLAMALGGNDSQNYQAGMGQQFMGYPVEFVNVMPSGGPTTDLASTIVAYFGDLAKAAVMGEARGLTLAADSSLYFASDQIAIRGTRRLDINIHDRGDSSNAGAIGALKMNTA